MRNGQNKRMRGRNRKSQNPLTRVYESNGPDVKIRGTASHVAEKYMQLARDAQSSGDPVSAENYYQHAEHYFRLIAAVQEQFRQNNPYYRESEQRDSFDDGDDDGLEPGMSEPPYAPREAQQPYPPRETQPFGREPRFGGGRDQQPYRQRDNRDRRDDRPTDHPTDHPNGTTHAGGGEQAEIGLPAFVTGGQPPLPSASGIAATPEGGFPEQNGFEAPADRFPLHRRRRRRHGPRPEAAPSGAPEAGE